MGCEVSFPAYVLAEPIVEKVQKCLSSWKEALFSRGRRRFKLTFFFRIFFLLETEFSFRENMREYINNKQTIGP